MARLRVPAVSDGNSPLGGLKLTRIERRMRARIYTLDRPSM